MSETTDVLIKGIIEKLILVNKDKKARNDYLLDIPMLISPLYSELENGNYNEFLEEISNYKYSLDYEEDNTQGYTDGKFIIELNNEEYYEIELFGGCITEGFNLLKIKRFISADCSLDETAYNNYLADFYKKYGISKKEYIERENRIKELEDNINKLQEELYSLKYEQN